MATGLPPSLDRQLQEALLACGPFASNGELQAVFSDARIAAWRHRLPEANSAAGRVAATVEFLFRRTSDRGENGLALLLEVLGERTPTGDECRDRLLALAERVSVASGQRQHQSPSVPPADGAQGPAREEAAVPIELREKMAAGEVALFVGHGISEAAGLPSRPALAQALAERLGEEMAVGAHHEDGQTLADMAELYEVARGRHALLSYLREALDTTLLQPKVVHRMIARLPVSHIFTTTYDNLLEQALREEGRRVNKVITDSMLPHASAGRVQLLKLKGEVEMPETIVVTRRDLDRYAISHPLMVNQLRDRLASMTFVLLGYGPGDPDLNLLFEQSGYQAGSGRLHYAVMSGVSSLQRQASRSRRIRVLEMAPGVVPAWLESLSASA